MCSHNKPFTSCAPVTPLFIDNTVRMEAKTVRELGLCSFDFHEFDDSSIALFSVLQIPQGIYQLIET